jgi:hypothetical protein
MIETELKRLKAISTNQGQYFVMRDTDWKLLKKKLIRHDSGGYLRTTAEGDKILTAG